MKELQEKYKDDKQRQQQEMMKFYRENKVNPFASCLPLVLQLPFFIALFYMLQDDLRIDICGTTRRAPQSPQPCGVGWRGELPLHPGPDGQGDRRGAGRAARPVRRLAAALERAHVGLDGQTSG